MVVIYSKMLIATDTFLETTHILIFIPNSLEEFQRIHQEKPYIAILAYYATIVYSPTKFIPASCTYLWKLLVFQFWRIFRHFIMLYNNKHLLIQNLAHDMLLTKNIWATKLQINIEGLSEQRKWEKTFNHWIKYQKYLCECSVIIG